MALTEINAAGEIDQHRAVAAVQQRHQAGHVDHGRLGGKLRDREAFSAGGADGVQAALHHEHVAMAHLTQPGASHPCTYAAVVDQCNARVADADPLIGRLHELPAGRADAARVVTRAVLGRIADVQHIERAVRIILKAGEVDGADHADAGLFREGLRALQCGCRSLRLAGCEPVGPAAIAAEAGQFPTHRAVAQCHDLVGNAGATQALRAHYAARAPGAVHHHERLRVGRDVADAIYQLAARDTDAGGDRHAHELLVRAAVEHHDVLPAIDP